MNRKKFFLSLLCGMAVLAVSAVAFAQEAMDSATAQAVARSDMNKWIALAAGIGIAIAAFGGALGQGRAAAAALGGIARNPGAADKMFTPMILGLALIESLVIYALIIAFLLVGKIA
ncbi:MAG: ATP synthase F0 subunit C [Deltaproteobacteria bacterium]|nr:ATP synthase F0 subunit C [Deltaproteobacteria bacterium]